MTLMTDVSDGSALHLALRCGTARFLRLQELLATVNACALLRGDAALARESVMETADFAWFPAVLTDAVALASASRRLHEFWERPDERWALGHPQRRAQLLALAAFLKTLIMRWCFVYESAGHEDSQRDVLWSVRPALIPIGGGLGGDWQQGLQAADAEAALMNLRERLNAMASGFGDAFTGSPPQASASRFSVHWENISLDGQSGRAQCSLCAAATHSVRFYRHQAALFHQRFNEKLIEQRRNWTGSDGHKAMGQGFAASTEAFRRAHFPPGAYIGADALRWSDSEVLQQVLRHGKFQLEGSFGSVSLPSEFRSADMARCVTSVYQQQCRRFYQPLKKLLARQFKLVGRVQLRTLEAPADRRDLDSESRQAPLVEFVGGLDTATGSLCGVYCSFR